MRKLPRPGTSSPRSGKKSLKPPPHATRELYGSGRLVVMMSVSTPTATCYIDDDNGQLRSFWAGSISGRREKVLPLMRSGVQRNANYAAGSPFFERIKNGLASFALLIATQRAFQVANH